MRFLVILEMYAMQAILSALLGLLIGSFLNVVIHRLPDKNSILSPPSRCPACGHRLGPLDLLPVFGYLLLKGRCRYCGIGISARYPLVELLTAGLFGLLFWRFGWTPLFLKYAFLSSLLLAAAFIDWDHRIIPDRLNLAGFLAGLAFLPVAGDVTLAGALSGLAAGGGFLLLVAVLSRGAMGGGDIKLFGVVGLFLGFEKTVLAMLLTFLIGGLVSLFLLATGIKGRKDYIPFGPFISAGSLLSLLWYHQILLNYVTLLK